MEPYKNIKNKLNAREIQPSANSWDRLDAMLSLQENQKNKRSFSWLYIAASFLVFMGLGFWFYPENKIIVPVESNVVIEVNKDINTNLLVIDSLKTEEALVETKVQTYFQETTNQSKVVKKQSRIQENKNIAVNSNLNNSIVVLENIITHNEVEKEVEVKQVLEKKTFKFKIDANSLLSAAEKEMDKEYKETNLDKLSRNFKEVKSALANRNYE